MQNQTKYDDEKLASTFIKHGLVDEFRLYIHPVVLGGGKQMFPVEEKLELEFVESQTFPGELYYCVINPAKVNRYRLLLILEQSLYIAQEPNGVDYRGYTDIFDHRIPVLKENNFSDEEIR